MLALYMYYYYCVGGDLFDRLVVKQSYSENEARHVIKRLLSAMTFLHSENIAHRDLKPENILLVSKTNDIEIKLTDFGLAKQIDTNGNKRLKTYCGTPQVKYYLTNTCTPHAI